MAASAECSQGPFYFSMDRNVARTSIVFLVVHTVRRRFVLSIVCTVFYDFDLIIIVIYLLRRFLSPRLG